MQVLITLKSLLIALVIAVALLLNASTSIAKENSSVEIFNIISKEEFSTYKNVADFIEQSPKVTIIVQPEQSDIEAYGQGVSKSLTGSDCDRDGKMDDNPTCNAVYLKLWLKYER